MRWAQDDDVYLKCERGHDVLVTADTRLQRVIDPKAKPACIECALEDQAEKCIAEALGSHPEEKLEAARQLLALIRRVSR